MTRLLDPPPDSSVEIRCRGCGVPLAADQRYCVSCGARVAGPREAESRPAGASGAAAGTTAPATADREAAPPDSASPGPAPDRLQMVILAVAAIALPAFGLGLLIGDRGEAPAPQIVTIAAAPAAAGAPASAPATSFADTWPAGTRAWTVQLVVLPKASATPEAVARAREDAVAKGAPDVGTLDSDAHPPMTAGDYVVYSGVFPKRADANAALKRLRGDFPDASVVRIGTADEKAKTTEDDDAGTSEDSGAGDPVTTRPSDPKALSPEEFQKRSKKLPSETAIPGDAPAPDGAAPGGDAAGDVVEIG